MRSRDRKEYSLDHVLCLAMLGRDRVWPAGWEGSGAIDLAVDRIRYHGIAPLLVTNGSLPESWPPKVRAFVHEEARLRSLWEAQHGMMIASLLERLDTVGVDCLVLKGTALAYSLWEDPALRSRGDTDIFVCRDDFDTARKVLGKAGWSVGERHVYQETWQHHDGAFLHAIDLHWRLRDETREAPSLSFAACRARSLPVPRLWRNARMTDYATTLVNCAINHAAHRSFGYSDMPASAVPEVHLGHLADVGRLAKAMTAEDWRMTVRLARDGGIAQPVVESISLAQDWLEARVSPSVLDDLEEIAEMEREMSDPVRRVPPPASGKAFMERFGAAIGWHAKLGYLRRRIWPPAKEFATEASSPTGRRLAAARLRRIARICKAMILEPLR